MKILNADDLKSLKHGDFVYRQIGSSIRRLRYVARMPGCENYLILCDGEYLTHLHISSKDDTFGHKWYAGDLTADEIDYLAIEWHKDQIEVLNKTIEYFKKNP